MKKLSSSRQFQLERRFLCLSALISMLLVDIEPAYSEIEGISVIEEIVVTARKREESSLRVPVAVSTVTAETLNQMGTTDLRDLGNYIPGLTIERGGTGAGGTISLRGLSSSPIQSGFEQTVSVAVDGVQTGRPRIISLGLMDLQQIDVVRGPQALVYGKNSPAGVIDIKTANPGMVWSGYARTSHEFKADEHKFEGAFGGPLTDIVGFRAAATYRDMKGWVENSANRTLTDAEYPFNDGTNPFNNDAGYPTVLGHQQFGEEELSGRITLTFTPSDKFDTSLKVTYGSYEDDGPSASSDIVRCSANSPTTPTTSGFPDPFGDCKADGNISRGSMPVGQDTAWPYAASLPYSDVDQLLGALTLNLDLTDNITLTSVTGYYDLDSKVFDSFDATSYFLLNASEREQYQSASQELRLTSDFYSSINFMVGLYYQDTKLDFLNASKILSVGPDARNGSYVTWVRPGKSDGKTLSAFAQVIADLSEEWELAGGIRYTDEEKDSSNGHSFVHSFGGLILDALPEGIRIKDKFADTNLSPEITLTWRPSDKITSFISYRTGYKSGGMGLSNTFFFTSAKTLDEITEGVVFDAEEINGFEAGVKMLTFQDRMRLSITAFDYDYDDLQVTSFDGESISFQIKNAATASTTGVEIETMLQLNDNISLFGALNWLDAEYDDFPGAACYDDQTQAEGCVGGLQNLAGTALSRASEWSGVIGFDFNRQVNSELALQFGVRSRYQDEFSATDTGDPGGLQDAHWNIDAHLQVEFRNRYGLSLIGRNLSDERSCSWAGDKPGGASGELSCRLNRGRQFAIQAHINF